MKRFYHDAGIRFECQAECAQCCQLSNGYVFLTEEEAAKIAEDLNISEHEFLQHFTRIIDNQLCLVDGEDDHCVFLEDYKCSIYKVRPMQCRTYPFWPENLKSKSRWQLIKNECPGIGKGRIYSAREIEDIVCKM